MPEAKDFEDAIPECPLVSTRVSCDSCESADFNIDTGSPRIEEFVPGRCDDCGYTLGKLERR